MLHRNLIFMRQVLSVEDLSEIVNGNEVYKTTIYKDLPELLFRLGSLILVDMVKGKDSVQFHFVLSAPNLAQQTLYRVYTPVVVPLASEDGMCLELDLPSLIFLDRSELRKYILTSTMRSQVIYNYF